MSLSSKEIKEILSILEDSGWDEAEVSVGDVTLAVSKLGSEGFAGSEADKARGHDGASATGGANTSAPAPASGARGESQPPPPGRPTAT
jgi:hypothetical protein